RDVSRRVMLQAMSSNPSPAPPGPPWRSHTCRRFFAVPSTRLTKKTAFLPSGSLQSSGTSTCAHSASRPSVPVYIAHGVHETRAGLDAGGSGCTAAGGGAAGATGVAGSTPSPHAEKVNANDNGAKANELRMAHARSKARARVNHA